MVVGVRKRLVPRIVAGIGALVVLGMVLAQLFLPSLAARRVRDRVARYGTVKSAHVSAFPAVKLLWGKADSVSVSASALAVAPAQIASLLWEAHDVDRMTVTADSTTLSVPSLPSGLNISNTRMDKHGEVIHASAVLTQQQLDAALPGGFHIEPVASEDGSVEARASGGFFGLQASINALVKPIDGKLVVEPQNLPFGGFAKVTLFSDPHLRVQSVGLRVLRSQPLTYGLSLSATLR
jgi:hypothetical protein